MNIEEKPTRLKWLTFSYLLQKKPIYNQSPEVKWINQAGFSENEVFLKHMVLRLKSSNFRKSSTYQSN